MVRKGWGVQKEGKFKADVAGRVETQQNAREINPGLFV
jgi:hypothetical protein